MARRPVYVRQLLGRRRLSTADILGDRAARMEAATCGNLLDRRSFALEPHPDATAAGSVITEGVPPGSRAIGRERQENKDGYDARRKSDGTDKK